MPLDDLFHEPPSASVEATEAKQLTFLFRWTLLFSTLVWSIAVIKRFGTDLSIWVKSILLLGCTSLIFSTLMAGLIAFFPYKNFTYPQRFKHTWLIFMSFVHLVAIFFTILFMF